MRSYLAIVLLNACSVMCQHTGLFPAILNLASNAEISTNATCGETQPEMYCKLVEHVPDRRLPDPQCQMCDSHSTNTEEQHPITNAIDGTNQWWQSPSIKNGHRFHWVTITLDLRQIFQVAYIIVKAANSPRPGNWILERSMDGVEFRPWQYYATSDTECLTRYNVTTRRGPPIYRRNDEVVCTSYYSRLLPLENGEIHTSLINRRPSAGDLSPELLEFTSARYIRLRLQRVRTLNADLMTLSHRHPNQVDRIVTRRYYYSIKDISVGGMCICHGHALSCPWNPVSKRLQCACEHNTCGESCNKCCPGYLQELWQPGTFSDSNVCQKCNCNNKSDDCYYNQTVEDSKLSMDARGRWAGGGVCLNCSQHTAGTNCETCADGYFRLQEVSPYDDYPCAECACHPIGSLHPKCVKDDTHAKPEQGLRPGQCPCREGFTGERCDHCASGRRDFPLCARCNCSLDGSLNTDPCAECVCKENVAGLRCDLCKSGYYNLRGSNPKGCTECFCFGVTDVCESAPWTTIQVVKTDGSLLPAPQRDCDFTTSRSKVDNHTTNGNLTGSGSRKPHFLSSWVAPKQFLGNKLAAYGGLLNYTVSYNVPMGNVDKSLLFLFDVIIEGNGMTLRQAVGQQLLLAPQGEQHVAMEMTPWNFVDHLAGRVAKGDDLMIILANVTELRVRACINASTSGILRLHTLSLEMGDPSGTTSRLSHSVELCSCPQGHTGTSCEDCISGFYRAGGVLFGGTCLRCECNSHASQCDSNGTCLGCNHNTAGSRCGRCQAGFYGDPSVGTAEDCQRCACPLTVASNNFSPTCHLSATGEVPCDQCQQGYTGAHCEWCTDGYYGDPTFPGQGCGLCDCHGNVDPLEPGHCDPSTGECLKCVDHTAGQHCEQCRDGYFGDAIVAKDCQTCGCHGYGSNSSICDVTTGRCSCRPNVVGEKCNHCKAEHHGLLSGMGCVACNCSCEGSVSQECDEGGGCHCYPGVTGHKCNRCQHGFYNFQGLGCTVCDCDHAHGNCDPETGRCICPPHTRGEKCELCEEGHWGHDSVTGCKHCDCSGAGCLASQCDLTSGRCRCRPGFSGEKCDRCAVGFRAFPECTACNCNANGTQEEYCDEGVCGCEEAGNCACKDNVGGRGCDECKRGTFGLTNHNPAGCSHCFCSGVSSSCKERGGLVRVSITLGAGQVQLCSVSQRSLNGCLESLQNLSVLTNANLLQSSYWRLPAQFLGIQFMSYGGKLAYATSFASLNGTGQANSDPQVLMGGGRLRKVIMYLDWPAPPIRVKTSQEIPLTEAKWKYFNSVSDRVVTRLDFMSVLSNIEYILIKASYGGGTQQSRLLNVTVATAVDAEKGPAGGEVARLIEVCECPPAYTGLSCQECALGYYRQQFAEKNLKGHYTLARPCVPCQCHNHSLSCDPDTGKCQDCQHNTVGEQCNLCAPGHYGKVKGSISDCSLCACPRGNKKSFSPTCILEGISDFHCDSCERGYEGQHCQRCSAGYHGNPLAPNGRCRPCRCSVAGSLHPRCDPLTGRCRCRAGARGHLCRGCEKRHVQLGGLCVPCNDQCTRALLGKVAGLECSVRPLNLTGVVAAPYSLFGHLTNITNEIKILSSPRKDVTSVLQRVEEQLADLPEDITRLQHRADQLFGDGEDLAQSTEQSLNQSRELLELITVAQVSFQAWEAVRSLNGTLDEARSIQGEGQVENMKKMDYAHSNITVSNELSSAEAALQEVMRKYHRPQQAARVRAKTLAASLSKSDLQLQSAWTLLTTARDHSNHTFLLLGNISTTLEKLQDLNHSVFSVTREVGVELGAAQDLLLKALAMGEGVVNATSPRGELDHWISQLRNRMDVLEASRAVVVDLLHRAEDHVQGLNVDPWPIHSAVYGLRDVCLDGGAASRLTSAIAEAERLAETTSPAATSTLQLTVLSEEGSVTGTAARAVQRSTEILAASLALSNKTAFFIADSAHTKKRQGWIGDSVRNITSSLPATPTHILESSLANSTSEGGLVANRKAEMANASLLLAQHRMDDLSQQLEKSTVAVALANDNMKSTNELVSATEKNVRAAEFEVREMERWAGRLSDRLRLLRTLGEHLSRNLSEIRELIGQARQQASSIKVGMSVDGDCVRAYRPEISSSNFNTLTMTVKTSQPDNLLFYMGSNYSVDFMALEMHHGKVTFLWDLGSGYAELEYPDVQINNSKWHHIHATRFGKQGSLMIQEVMSDQKPAVRTASSPGSATVLGVNQSTLIFVGSPAGQIKKSPAVKMTNFTGCLGEVSLNGKNIGLWNYAMKQGPCRGCFMSLQAEEPSFHFDGNGFSVVEKSLRSTATHAVLLFKTFSPNGLLLYVASNGTRDFLSIELVEGKLQLTFDLGSGALTLTSTKAYNMGKWYRITLLRNRQKGILVVMDAQVPSDRETLEGESPGTASDLNRYTRDPIYIGGVPRSMPIRRQVVTRSYAGCMKYVEIARTNLDLLRDAFGVRKGCVLRPIRAVTVLKEGFLELPPLILAPPLDMMTTFSTRTDTGLILAGFGKAGSQQSLQPFLAVMLVSGQLEAHLRMEEGRIIHKAVLKSSTGSLSDGQEHSVILQYRGRTLTLLVDEDREGTMRLSSSESVILTLDRLYIGGVPPAEGAGMLRTPSSFCGCIKNLALNMELLDLSSALRYRNVDMDSCLLEEKPKSPVLLDDNGTTAGPAHSPAMPLEKCAPDDQTGRVPGAHQFGLSRNSHMIYTISHQVNRASFSLQLSVQTFASSGLLFYMAHPKQADYATLQLQGGHPSFTCNLGESPSTASHPEAINDGHWHTVRVDFGGKGVAVSVDGRESEPAEVKGNTLYPYHLDKLYLGGVPPGYSGGNISTGTHSIAGCVRDVALNDRPLDTRSLVSSSGTAGCFSTAQRGSFFNGTGFAAFVEEGYKVGQDVTVALEFRTTSPDGVLLGISSARADAIGLELDSGRVHFHVNNGAGRISVTYGAQGSFGLCDGRWHVLLATKSNYGLSLTVDGVTVHGENPHPQSTSADTNDPIYVGGYPGHVTQNCLTISAPFRGCMRDLRLIRGHMTNALNFTAAFDLRGVFPHSCPGLAI